MTQRQRQAGWLNAYDVASPFSEVAEKRTRRKIAVCRCHRFGTVSREVSHPFEKLIPDILSKPINFIVQGNNQGAQQLGALVALDAHHFKLFFGHHNYFQSVFALPTVAEAGSVARAPGGSAA